MIRGQKVGIISGGGTLPARVARACIRDHIPFFVIRLRGFADENVAEFEGEDCGIAEAGKLIRLLKGNDCDSVVLCGLVQRPDFNALKPDWRGASLIPKLIAAARSGDGAILNVVIDTLEAEGLVVVGAEEITQDLISTAGVIGNIPPSESAMKDIIKAASVISELGKLDIGQATVVSAGHVLAVEAAEGTDKMLERCADFSDHIRGGSEPKGVLVKRPKPQQELRVDLPTIGLETIRRAHKAKLEGIAVEAGNSLIMDLPELVSLADQWDMFIYGFTKEEVRQT